MNIKKTDNVKIEKLKNRDLFSPDDVTLYYCGIDKDLSPGARYGPVIRECYILEVCTGGRGSVIINGTEFEVKAGDVYLLFPGDTVVHTADTVCPREGYFCGFWGMHVAHWLSPSPISSRRPFAEAKAFEPILKLIKELYRCGQDKSAGVNLKIKGLICLMLSQLIGDIPPQQEVSDPINNALKLMEQRYHDPLTVSQIAAASGLERSYFSTLFKERTKLSPYDHLCRLRINKACALLKDRRCSVNVAATSCGIEPHNFARLFKKYLGTTPAKWLESIK
ncbi:MAG: AraC family transcriptional regulator [Ruminococcaceae bacterium]|nr:AraC family transcriptional regulator [Oscillospiraceae bacterium]